MQMASIFQRSRETSQSLENGGQVKVKDKSFTGTIGTVDQEKVDGMAEFQR